MGFLYVWELPFILIGIIAFLFIETLINVESSLYFYGFSCSVSGSGCVAGASRNAVIRISPTWQIFTAFGLLYVFAALRRIKILSLLTFAFFIVVSLQSFTKIIITFFPKSSLARFCLRYQKLFRMFSPEKMRMKDRIFQCR